MTFYNHNYDQYPELTNAQLSVLQFTSPHTQITEDFDADCVRVIDGDTIELSTDFRDFVFPLRIAEINAPEMNEGGQEAKDWLQEKIEGKKLRVEIDRNNRVGRYGRLLGKVSYNGLNVAQEMFYLGFVSLFEQRNEGKIDSWTKQLLEVAF